jgi:3-dehydroquinate synthase
MQKSFEIRSSLNSYQVEIGNSITEKFINIPGRNTILICDEALLKHYDFLKKFDRCVSVVTSEESKDLSNISDVISKLRNFSLKRGDLLIGVGGGVIQDITCFVASIYMRGVDWIYFPTTFLGMCDSCIGGKSSINVNGVKNLVGNFYPPKKIVIDTIFAKSLSIEQIDAGLFEAIKICYASFEKESFTKMYQLSLAENVNHFDVISLSLETKKWFIETDEFDVKERQLLNFGHTFGHAIEGSCSYAIPHGIAVGFGMLWAICLSEKKDLVNSPKMKMLEDLVVKILRRYKNLCDVVKSIQVDELFNKFIYDKKHKSDKYVCILIDSLGALNRAHIDKNDEFLRIFKESFTDLKFKI